jgi:hypothetical protein
MLEELGVNRGASLAERRKRKLKATKAKIQKNKKKAA